MNLKSFNALLFKRTKLQRSLFKARRRFFSKSFAEKKYEKRVFWKFGFKFALFASAGFCFAKTAIWEQKNENKFHFLRNKFEFLTFKKTNKFTVNCESNSEILKCTGEELNFDKALKQLKHPEGKYYNLNYLHEFRTKIKELEVLLLGLEKDLNDKEYNQNSLQTENREKMKDKKKKKSGNKKEGEMVKILIHLQRLLKGINYYEGITQNWFIYVLEHRNKCLNKELIVELKSLLNFGNIVKQLKRGDKTKHRIWWEYKMIEEGISRIFANLPFTNKDLLNQIIDSEEMNIIENKLLKWSKCKLSLRKINSQKYFLNKNSFNNQNKIGLFDDWLLPFNFSSIYKITSKDTLQSEDYDYDIILLPGQQSHPLYSWRVLYQNDEVQRLNHLYEYQQIWIDKFLIPELEKFHSKPRILAMNLEIFQTNSRHNAENVPEYSVKQIFSFFKESMKKAKIGEKPIIFITFSFGGFTLKNILMEKEDPHVMEWINKTLGVVFIASPHYGSNIANQIINQYRSLLPATNVTDVLANYSVSAYECSQHFLTSLPVSKTTAYVIRRCKTKFHELNKNYIDLNIPTLCLSEGAHNQIKKLGNRSIVVDEKEANLCDGRITDCEHCHIAHKKHTEMQRVLNKNDQTFTTILSFIEKILQKNKKEP